MDHDSLDVLLQCSGAAGALSFVKCALKDVSVHILRLQNVHLRTWVFIHVLTVH